MRRWSWVFRFALGTVVAALVLCVVQVQQALTPPELPRSASRPFDWPEPVQGRDRTTASEIAAAVDADPFRPHRVRAPVAYRLEAPAQAVQELVAPAPEEAPPPQVRPTLAGTVVRGLGAGRFAILTLPSQAPRRVAAGDTIAGMEVVRVDRALVVLKKDSETLEIRLDADGVRSQ